MTPPAWWQTRRYVAVAALLSFLPLLWPSFAPLVDMPGHIGRYRILAEAGVGPLAQHFQVHWALIGNLGVDLLVLALHPLLDVEPATRLVVTAIPLLTVLAMLWVAREVHGRLPASAGFALPLAYSFSFQLGFVNFCLAAALAIAGLALWIRLARTAPPFVRALLFAPIACLVWVCHSFGWAMLGLFVWGAELQLRRAAGAGWLRAGTTAALMCVPMALPLAFMLTGGRDALSGDTGDWFNWIIKAQWVASLLRERWRPYDAACAVVLLCVLWTAIRAPRWRFMPVLGTPAMLGIAVFVALPRLFQGGSYVDMRLLPPAVALALLAIRVDPAVERRLALAANAFFAIRMTTTTIAFALYAHGQAVALRALPALPVGSAVLTLVNEPSSSAWSHRRFTHLAGIAIARRRVFVNEQWALAGQQLVRPLHPEAAPFTEDPSQIVHPADDAYASTDLRTAIKQFDRCTFTSVWTIGFPLGAVHARDLVPVWSDGQSAVYRVVANRAECARHRI